MNSGELTVDVPLASVESDCEDSFESHRQQQQQPPAHVSLTLWTSCVQTKTQALVVIRTRTISVSNHIHSSFLNLLVKEDFEPKSFQFIDTTNTLTSLYLC